MTLDVPIRALKKRVTKTISQITYSQELVYLQYDPLFGRAFDVICSDLFMSLIMSSARGGPNEISVSSPRATETKLSFRSIHRRKHNETHSLDLSYQLPIADHIIRRFSRLQAAAATTREALLCFFQKLVFDLIQVVVHPYLPFDRAPALAKAAPACTSRGKEEKQGGRGRHAGQGQASRS